MQIDWGSVPDWVAGSGAVFALVWARRAVRAAAEANKTQDENLESLNKERRQREKEQRRAQAEKVALWWERGGHGRNYDTGSGEFETRGPYPYYFLFSNTSDLPVTEVVFKVGGTLCLAVPYIAPQTNGGRAWEFDETFRNNSPEEFRGHGPSGGMAVLEFNDVAGRRWKRNLSGELAPVYQTPREPLTMRPLDHGDS